MGRASSILVLLALLIAQRPTQVSARARDLALLSLEDATTFEDVLTNGHLSSPESRAK